MVLALTSPRANKVCPINVLFPASTCPRTTRLRRGLLASGVPASSVLFLACLADMGASYLRSVGVLVAPKRDSPLCGVVRAAGSELVAEKKGASLLNSAESSDFCCSNRSCFKASSVFSLPLSLRTTARLEGVPIAGFGRASIAGGSRAKSPNSSAV